jgi:hypothetical protein
MHTFPDKECARTPSGTRASGLVVGITFSFARGKLLLERLEGLQPFA